MKLLIRQIVLISAVILGILACSNGSSTSTSSAIGTGGGIGDSDGIDSSYTLVIYYPPGNTATAYYNDLLSNLSVNQVNVPVSRILLSVQNPHINNLFDIESTVQTSGLAVQFLFHLAQTNTDEHVEVYVYPDVESSSGWESWVPPVANPPIVSCTAITTASDTQHQNVLKSVCWASLVNQLVSKESSGLVAINGVAYDGQSFILGDYDSTRSWIHNNASADGLKFGWISGALKPYVDLNLIEVYGIGKWNHTPDRVDSIAPETVVGLFDQIQISPSCLGEFCSYTGIFPGTQWATNTAGLANVGAVGANIYKCAISSLAMLATNGCDNYYESAVNVESSPDSQMLQSLNYIYFNIQQQELNQAIFYNPPPQLPLPQPSEADSAVVYLFSTQYIGPIQSYYGSNLQCSEESGNCNCIASKYNSTALCGEENDFGSWTNNLFEFKQFTNKFLVSQEVNGKCPAPGGCAVGIYMYDFIPQKWYQKQ